MDMFDTYLDRCEKLFARIWDAGYHFDGIRWPDDMGYKGTSFFSAETYRKILKPFHTRAVQWAHDRGIYAELHSCGNIMGLLDDVIETGIDCLNPLEVKAGMDAIGIKEKYGAKIALRGGIDASKWNKTDEILAEICISLVSILDIRADALSGCWSDIFSFMLQATSHPNASVSTQATGMFLCYYLIE